MIPPALPRHNGPSICLTRSEIVPLRGDEESRSTRGRRLQARALARRFSSGWLGSVRWSGF